MFLRDSEWTFEQLLSLDESVSIHPRSLQLLTTEIFKTNISLNSITMEEFFKFKNVTCNLWNAETLNRNNVKFVKYRTGGITTSLSMFKSKIKNWEADAVVAIAF